MPRRRQNDEPDNHDRWLVSYADFITLLFAFFVVMYAISSVNENKYRELASSLGAAFNGTHVAVEAPLPIASPVPLPPRRQKDAETLRRERERMTAMAREILDVLAPLVEQGKVRVTQLSRGINVEINASVLFASGDAKLGPASGQALQAVAAVLKKGRHAIQVEGHTDNTPIETTVFPSNWELAAVRASSVVRLFIENGVAENRLTAVGYGSTRPVDDNATVQGRLRNRRVQVLIQANLPERAIAVPVSSNRFTVP